MKLSSFKYLTGEGIKNVWANRLMTIASVGVLTACMVLIGLALLVSFNVDKAIGNLEQQNVVMVYFNDKNSVLYGDADPILADGETFDSKNISDSQYLIHNEQEAKALCEEISLIENVASVEYIPKEVALESIKSTMLEGKEQYFEFLDEEGGNPLSDGARVKLNDMTTFTQTVDKIKTVTGVNSIQSQNDLADKINSIKSGIAVAGFWIIGVLLIISLVIVSNTIRVTMYNRKLQISIMKAVGATDRFIRFPFIIEGMVIGVVSALLSEGLVYFCYRVATDTIKSALDTTDIVLFSDTAFLLLGIFVSIGIFAGAFGSAIMIGKYLKKEGSEFSAI